MFSLKDKIALITGAGSGIGASIAETFALAGARVFVTDRAEDAGRTVVQQVESAGGKAVFMPLDVSVEADSERAAARVLEAGRPLDILVNNAGIGHVGNILGTTGTDLERLFQVNVRGVFNMSKAFLPQMIKAGRGSIVNIASIGGIV